MNISVEELKRAYEKLEEEGKNPSEYLSSEYSIRSFFHNYKMEYKIRVEKINGDIAIILHNEYEEEEDRTITSDSDMEEILRNTEIDSHNLDIINRYVLVTANMQQIYEIALRLAEQGKETKRYLCDGIIFEKENDDCPYCITLEPNDKLYYWGLGRFDFLDDCYLATMPLSEFGKWIVASTYAD